MRASRSLGNAMARRWLSAAVGMGTFGLGFGRSYSAQAQQLQQKTSNPFEPKQWMANYKPLPGDKLITLDEMEAMCDQGRIVVSFQGAVYDVTNFTGHPGGYGRLQMAAGHDLEAFWKVYTQHNRGHIVGLLQRYRIGKLSAEEAEQIRTATKFENPYTNDPPSYPDLLTNTRYPYNAEGNLRELGEHWVTPVGKHFVRNHGLVPEVDEEDYELEVGGLGVEQTYFSLEDLKTKFDKVDVTTVIQCNGNRREDYHYLKDGQPAFGPPHWVAGAIGNATWSGARLRDVLKASGMDVDTISLNKKAAPVNATYVGLRGMDHDECGNHYCCSFPFEKAIDPFGDVILAYEMNGQPIPRAHGYPVRAIVPGHAGARNCKFLERITVTGNPCLDAGNWKQYAVHAMDVPLYKLQEFENFKKELKRDPAVQEMPVQSLITSPGAGDVVCVKDGKIRIKGVAWGGGGEGVNRVDVSVDNGKTFTRADMCEPPVKQRRKANWAWVFFEKDVNIDQLPENLQADLAAGKPIETVFTSKALNTSWNVQPENAESNINPHGCCVNHWYRVPVKVCPVSPWCIPSPLQPGEFPNKPSGGSFRSPFSNFKQPCPEGNCLPVGDCPTD